MRATSRSGVAAAVLLGGAVCAACSTPPESTAPKPSATTSSASPTPTVSTDPQAATKTQIIAAYKGFWAAMEKSLSDPKHLPDAGLRNYGDGEALSAGLSTVIFYRHREIAFKGSSTMSVSIVGLGSSTATSASTEACVDSSKWIPVFVKSGKPAEAPGQLHRLVVSGEMKQQPVSGAWKLQKFTIHRDRPC